MTNLPEAFLAREAQIAYSSLCLITDYDCWMEDPAQHVSVEAFFQVYDATLQRAIALLQPLLSKPFTETPISIREALNSAMLTPAEQLNDAQRQWFEVLTQ